MRTELAELAMAHGVATQYEAGNGKWIAVQDHVVIAVLRELGVHADTEADIRDALTQVREQSSNDQLPPTIVLRQSQNYPLPGPGTLHLEDGTTLAVVEELPADLPLGWHRLSRSSHDVTVVVAPDRLPQPPRTWGWMLQLYALRSDQSWGMGDFADLTGFVRWAGSHARSDVILVNPVSAITPLMPVQASPYSPSSRRFTNPLYLRIEETTPYRQASTATRQAVDALRVQLTDKIDYDAVWRAKLAALELLWAQATDGEPSQDPAVIEFATFCALTEIHGPHWQEWPTELRHPRRQAMQKIQVELAERIAFHGWIQQLCHEQLTQVTTAARESGMRIGILHDLPIGAAPDGADAWAWQDVLASGINVGAPPDSFNQQGQDWSLPPWNPMKLAAAGYLPYRDLLRSIFRHANGIRIDHIAGLWRLWWIPRGLSPQEGTYVRYDAEAMLGILALEAYRANACVVGEDLGTVEPIVTESLHDNNMLSSAVLWFERNDDRMIPPDQWPALAAASLSTHDLPTALGFLRAEHVRIRAALGLLNGQTAAEYDAAERDKRALLHLLEDEGLISDSATEAEVVTAMHALLARAASQLVLLSPYDLIGEVAQPNLPGTSDQYPNWRIPLPMSWAEFATDPRVLDTIALLSKERGR